MSCRGICDPNGERESILFPGNHDIYLPITFRERRFPAHFAGFLQSDLPQFACDLPAGRFPCVKLRGPVAIIALSSAVPRPPFVSAGHLGREQLVALARLLEHPVAATNAGRPRHHPPFDTRAAPAAQSVVDAAALRDVLHGLAGGLVLCGHTHMRVLSPHPARGTLRSVSASCASARP
jgi:3',5'-cyclic AMP phosphodiesterase CpdA